MRLRKIRITTYFILAMTLPLVGADTAGSPIVSKNRSSAGDSKPAESGYAPVNGIKMYYEIHGTGEGVPLVLLHGGGSTIEVTFSKVLPIFAQHRKVIAVEEQGHGRTTGRDQPVRFETSADDVAALLAYLNIQRADIFGFSNGASVALQVAIRHPERVRKLVFASSMTRKDGASPQFWSFIEQADFSDMPQPLKEAFLKVNPDPQKLRSMHDKDLERMRNFKDVSDRDIRSVSGLYLDPGRRSGHPDTSTRS